MGRNSLDMKTTAIIKVLPYGDHLRIQISLPKNTYGLTTDDGSLSLGIDQLIENIMKKELGFTKHDIMMAISKIMLDNRRI